VIAGVILLALVVLIIASIEADQPARVVMRKQSRQQRDLRDALWAMRRRR
jgi:heme exporter protein D